MDSQNGSAENKIGTVLHALQEGVAACHLEARVRVSPGWRDNIHVHVIAEGFRSMAWPEREKLVWSLLEDRLDEELVSSISLLMVETPEEAAPDYDEIRARHEDTGMLVGETEETYEARTSKPGGGKTDE